MQFTRFEVRGSRERQKHIVRGLNTQPAPVGAGFAAVIC